MRSPAHTTDFTDPLTIRPRRTNVATYSGNTPDAIAGPRRLLATAPSRRPASRDDRYRSSPSFRRNWLAIAGLSSATQSTKSLTSKRRRDYSSIMKTSALFAAAVLAAIAGAAPASAVPWPIMDHDGIYIVGKDVPPGLYLTLGANGDGICSWARIASVGNGGDSQNVIERGDSRDAQYAGITPTDRIFETHGCQSWSIGTRAYTPVPKGPPTCIYPLTGCIHPPGRCNHPP